MIICQQTRGALSSGDGLALSLPFAETKSLTALVGPTPTFTRASSATFVGSNGLIQSAGNNVARFDHNPLTLACNGLFMEEARTNRFLQSENFGTTWVASQLNNTGSPSYINVATAPDGQTTADKLIPNTVSGTHQFRQDVSLAASTAYTLSCYFKAGELSNVALAVVGTPTGNNDWSCFFNVSTGVTTGLLTGFTSSTITNVGNGWYRCSAVFTTTVAGTASLRISGANTSGNSTFFVGDSASGFFVWGAQLEAGAFPTSYIPTTTASAVRSADVCSISGSAFSGFYNQTAGTALVKTIGGDSVTGRALFRFSGTIAPIDSISIVGYSRFLAAEISIVTNNSQQLVHFSTFSRDLERLSLAYAQNSAAFFRNGIITAVDNSVITSSSITQLSLGGEGINGCITSFRYYRKRLPNAKLQALTV